jgi:hypothetical protein
MDFEDRDPGGNGDVFPDGGDFSSLNEHGAVFDDTLGNCEDRAAPESQVLGHPSGNLENQESQEERR